MSKTIFFHRHGEIRDLTFENQSHRASGLNLAVAAVILWNTVHLSHAVAELCSHGEVIPDELLTHIAPFGWEHIIFNGDYVWPRTPLKGGAAGVQGVVVMPLGDKAVFEETRDGQTEAHS